MIHKPGRTIPVSLGRAPPGSAADFIGRPPITYVRVLNPANGTTSDTLYEALIDTGADVIAIDKIVAENIGLELTGSGITRGFGGQNSEALRARVRVFFPSVNLTFEAPNAGVLDFKSAGLSFDLILGRAFLKYCLLTVDGPNAGYHLQWVG